ncbi:hypothetical protein AVEN_84652-1 [Araneus ventricosus]|uniref:Uncharacterized protein n=1 Tax=Araneus ventricosus TaxID=182803 RepID=A0A4Y2HK53_ARAVE|nr:hypothetical protein AVEN_84652-1 [Araneus ventricosus]
MGDALRPAHTLQCEEANGETKVFSIQCVEEGNHHCTKKRWMRLKSGFSTQWMEKVNTITAQRRQLNWEIKSLNKYPVSEKVNTITAQRRH